MSSIASTASSQPKKPKGILKKPTTTATTTTNTSSPPISPLPVQEHKPASSSSTAREAAIQQARIIQQQQAFEDEIQDSIIELAKLPLATTSSSSTSTYDSSNPSPSDADTFRQLVRLFQPGDYEDLIEERNTLKKCGYALCPRPRLRLGPGGEYKLVGWGRSDFGIVPRKELERWCSRECARRAMYVKVQLGETAAWERAGISSIRIDLLDEPKQAKEEEDDATRQLERELQSVERKAAQDAKDLALERGDAADKPSTRKIKLTIREKSVKMAPQEPTLDKDGEGHLVLDGYKPKFNQESEQKGEDENMEDDSEKPTAE
ncbi:hypothetical protein F5Y00DRAFT_98725 [Daldinia vernicosa]|uniref:uncharacterized protein n=1 Tax=Daldinia vernicosa TaxID=114800 RepID=UPI0020081C8A|nr:uncharacterized protein F5Y00DRAFT_98725 [Daldinia vernicosa]KAI0848121.1 hypothetical protein F5Y00DRAFT_98725 [Daldinia vernicosa]